jgi:hypothetical protein
METLPQPYTWTCDRCQQPIAAWDLDTRSPHDAPLCIECLLPITPEDARKNVELRYTNLDILRDRTRSPPGTLIGAEGPTMGQYPSYFALIGVDAWDPSLPQRVRPCWWWEDGQGPSLIVLLAATVTIDWSRGIAWELAWSWERPEKQAFCALQGWEKPLGQGEGKFLMAALNAFRQEISGGGRPRGSGARFETREDFVLAVLKAIDALRKAHKRATRAAIGRYIGRTYRPSLWDDTRQLADPGKQISRWAHHFRVDIDELIRGH